jgi:hypothetical protein
MNASSSSSSPTFTPSTSARRHHSIRGGVLCSVSLALLLFANSAIAISFSLTQTGGTAQNGRGQVGDTLTVAVDVAIGADELTTGIFASLGWDQNGGNVLDIVSATEGTGGFLGPYPFRPINSNYILFDNPTPTAPLGNARSFSDGTDFADTVAGPTVMVGFELAPPVVDDDALLTEIINNGAPGPANFHLGEVTFRLASLGTTTLEFFRDPNLGSRTLVVGARGILFDNDQIQFTDIPVSAIGFGTLQIVVVPEPSAALLIALGLIGLASRPRLT